MPLVRNSIGGKGRLLPGMRRDIEEKIAAIKNKQLIL